MSNYWEKGGLESIDNEVVVVKDIWDRFENAMLVCAAQVWGYGRLGVVGKKSDCGVIR